MSGFNTNISQGSVATRLRLKEPLMINLLIIYYTFTAECTGDRILKYVNIDGDMKLWSLDHPVCNTTQIHIYVGLVVSEWVGFNGTSTQFRSLAPSLTRKAVTESPTVKESRRYINLAYAI